MPHLARLNNQGQYNAWSTDTSNSFIQVSAAGDSGFLWDSCGPSSYLMTSTCSGGLPAAGCDWPRCSLPLGMESGAIEDHRITASSTASSWYSGPWTPSLARLNRRGNINAWQAKNNNMNQWLQVELPQVKKITGIITQGAKSLGKEMFVDSYSLQYSNDGIRWIDYTDDEDSLYKTFSGNTNNNDHVKNYIYPPIFSRFIRIIPRNWTSSITMRIELLGCDFE
uniref:Coagulation factor V n=1 Tax=Echeneis naucrates TaxID=173247 RepID=A0A665V3Z5_ECHNA